MKDDTISRAAALDALDKVAEMFPYRIPGKAKTYRQYNEAWSYAIDAAENALEALPSAQPVVISKSENTTECEDAVSREAVLNEIHRYMEERDYTIGLLDDNVCGLPSVTPKQPGWIPTSVRLPEEKTAVLITTTKGCVIQCMYWGYQNGHHTWRSLGNQYLYWEMDVVAWMPLPKPWEWGQDD